MNSGKEARAAGVARYYTGRPCKYGHVSERYSHTGQCTACARVVAAGARRKPGFKIAARAAYEERRKTPEKIMLMSAKNRSRRFKLPCDITESDIRDVWPSDGLCPILGIPLIHNYDRAGSYCEGSPSLDKKIPSLGYVRGNIVVVSMKANRLKSNETDHAVFLKIAAWMEVNIFKRSNVMSKEISPLQQAIELQAQESVMDKAKLVDEIIRLQEETVMMTLVCVMELVEDTPQTYTHEDGVKLKTAFVAAVKELAGL